LVAVLVVISILSYSAYEFAHWVEIETETAIVQGRETQNRYLAESAVAYLEGIERLRRQGAEVPALDNQADYFADMAVSLEPAEPSEGTGTTEESPSGRFTIRCSPASSGGASTSMLGETTDRYGVESEGARVHLNAWWERDPTALEAFLLQLPGGTKELVAGVLDWLDADDDPRDGGAEREDYEKFDPPILPRNGPVESLTELLLVRGMTPEIFWGEDLNRNGQLDPEENDGERNPPLDDEDGTLDVGWGDYLTLWSMEPNLDGRGKPRVWLNDSDLGRLFTLIEREFGVEWAQWVVSARVLGSAGMIRDPASPELGPYHFTSLLDLIDARVEGVYENQPVRKESPLVSAASDFFPQLARVLDRWTVEWEPAVAGRLDLTSARSESLAVLTPLSEEDRKKVVEGRPAVGGAPDANSASPAGDERLLRGTLAWLLEGGLISRQALRSIERTSCSTSRVVRFEAIGWQTGQRQSHRLELVMDTSSDPPRVRSRWRMDRWGSVNSLQQGNETDEAKELPSLGDESEPARP
jgi:hypothetical protein